MAGTLPMANPPATRSVEVGVPGRGGARVLAVAGIALGGLGLLGWLLGVDVLAPFAPGLRPTRAAGALVIIVLSAALGLSVLSRPAPRWAIAAPAGMVALLASLTVLEYLFNVSFGFDGLLPGSPNAPAGAPSEGRIAFHGAVAALAAGLAVPLIGRSWRGVCPSEILGAFVGIIGLVSLLGYAYGSDLVASFGMGSQTSLTGSLAMLVLGCGIVDASPNHRLVRTFSDPGVAGQLARRSVPVLFVFLPVGWLAQAGQRVGLLDGNLADVLVTAVDLVVVIVAAAWLGGRAIAIQTGQLAAESAVRQSEAKADLLAGLQARLAAAVDQTAESVIITDPSADILYVNPAFERVTGYGVAEVVGRNPRILQSGRQTRGSYRAMWATLTSGRTWRGELVNRRKDGSTFTEEASISPVLDADGTLSAYVAVKRDVTHLREVEADLALVGRIRTALAMALSRVGRGASLDEAANALCAELAAIESIDLAGVGVFLSPDDALLFASSGPPGFPMQAGDHLPPHRSRRIRERTMQGPWAGPWQSVPEDGEWGRLVDAAGLRAFAFGPIIHGDHVDGGVFLGTRDRAFARTLVDAMPRVVDFSTMASGLLGERLHAHMDAIALRQVIGEVLRAGAYHPVFQPIIEFASGDTVAYEALTRFDSGQAPDRCFADAMSVGLGEGLELATLSAAIDAAHRLPAGRWLHVNMSARVLDDPDRLRTLFERAGRPVVIEITEHEVIADYGAVRAAVDALGSDIRLAVDDAGAGVANFRHIVELRPDFVKLDLSLVRDVNVDLARQAVVVAMRHFARTSGCRLVAEGVETEAESRTLIELGVEYGQGYLFGRPEAAASTSAA